jgi:hypothetical protein
MICLKMITPKYRSVKCRLFMDGHYLEDVPSKSFDHWLQKRTRLSIGQVCPIVKLANLNLGAVPIPPLEK